MNYKLLGKFKHREDFEAWWNTLTDEQREQEVIKRKKVRDRLKNQHEVYEEAHENAEIDLDFVSDELVKSRLTPKQLKDKKRKRAAWENSIGGKLLKLWKGTDASPKNKLPYTNFKSTK